MLLPTKGIPPEKALLTVGARSLALMVEPTPVSSLWQAYQREHSGDRKLAAEITFDWFALSLSVLFSIGLLEATEDGLLRRIHVSP